MPATYFFAQVAKTGSARLRERVYQVYLQSFFDSNGDGIGDLKGLIAKLDYIKRFNPDAIWVTPFFEAPDGPEGDGGYAPSCYRSVAKKYGTFEDIDNLVREAAKRGMRVYMDLPLAHTAASHEWFQKSRAARMRGDLSDPYAHFYVWHQGPRDANGQPAKDQNGQLIPPNNWQSSFGGKAWSYDQEVGLWYMHNFSHHQPSLNLNDERAQLAIFEAAAFWAKKGLHLRLDAMTYLNYDPQFRDNVPLVEKPAYYKDYDMIGTMNPVMTGQMLKNFRNYLDAQGLQGTRLLGEALNAQRQKLDDTKTLPAYPDGRRPGIHCMEAAAMFAEPENGGVGCYTGPSLNGAGFSYTQSLGDMVDAMLKNFTNPAMHYWSFSNHDRIRIATRWTEDLPENERDAAARLLFRILNTLPGSVCIYQGEAEGYTQARIPEDIPLDKIKDPAKEGRGIKAVRDGARTPMVWHAHEKNAGFTIGDDPYLPIAQAHIAKAADAQEYKGSFLNTSREFLEHCDRQPALKHGHVTRLKTPKTMLALLYQCDEQVFLCVHNITSGNVSFNPSEFMDNDLCKALGLTPGHQLWIEPYGSKFPGAREPDHNFAQDHHMREALRPAQLVAA